MFAWISQPARATLVYDQWGRVVAEYGATVADVKAEFIWAVPPAVNDPGSGSGAGSSPFGGGDHIGGYSPLAVVAENASSALEVFWVHGDHLGVPLLTTNAQGQVVTPAHDFLRPGFPGQSQVLSDLYYNRARDYDPLTGRYIQADPIGLWGGSNPYLYAEADPINMIDPRGELAWWVVPVGFALWEVGSQAYNLWMRGCDPLSLSNYNYGRIAFAFGSGLAGGGLGYGGTRLALAKASTKTKQAVGELFGRASVYRRGARPRGRTGNDSEAAGRVPGLGPLSGRARRAKPDFHYRRGGQDRVLETKFRTNPPSNPRNALTPAQRALHDQIGDRMDILIVTPGSAANAAGVLGAGAGGVAGQVPD